MEEAESGTQAPRDSAPMARPLVLPEPYSGEKDFTESEDVAAINGWDENAKLAWLKVRLTEWAQTAFKRLPQSAREGFTDAVKALKERFEPTSKRELYTAEFQVRRKEKKQDWADFAQDLRVLADKAFPDLQVEARDCLSLNRFIDQITDPQINFAVKQRRPKTMDEVVAATLEMESYQTPAAIKVGQVTPDEYLFPAAVEEAVVGAVNKDGGADILSVSSMLQSMMKQMDRLEGLPNRDNTHVRGNQLSSGTSAAQRDGTVVC